MKLDERRVSGSERLVGLDILRASAIVLVLLAHSPFLVEGSGGPIWVAFGLWGVELFFALSGFLITGLLYRVFRDFSLAKLRIYFARRWLRTIPLFYFAIVVTIFVERFLMGFPIIEIERYFLFIQTVPTGKYQWFGVAWSLSVEEWSYVLFPCAAAGLWFVRSLDRRFALMFATAIVAFTAYRLSLGAADLHFDTEIRRALIPRLDAIAYGGLLRVLHVRYREALYEARFQLLAMSILGQGVCLVLLFTYGNERGVVVAALLTLLPVSICFCLPFVVTIERVVWPLRRTFFYLASRSYALYLFHFPIFYLIGKHLTDVALPVSLMFGFGLAVVIADVAYRTIEKPVMDRRPAERRNAAPDIAVAEA